MRHVLRILLFIVVFFYLLIWEFRLVGWKRFSRTITEMGILSGDTYEKRNQKDMTPFKKLENLINLT